jgi:CRP/FNR family transcriptional regulator
MTMIDGPRHAVLGVVPLFAEATVDDLAALADVATEVEFPAGRTLVRQGDTGNGLFIILDGSVRIVRDGETLNTLGPGEWFGELAVLDRGPRTATVIAETDTRCLALAAWDAERLLEERAGLALGVARTLAVRLRDLTEDHRH